MTIDHKKFEFIFNLRTSGVTDSMILNAMEHIPRDHFVGKMFKAHAFSDTALPIDCGQTITQPSIIGIMTQALRIDRRSKILEIGTGSGYQTSILAKLGRRIYSIERFKKLAETAKRSIEELGIANVTILCEDGALGLLDQAPFDRIIVCAAVEDVPSSLLNQLKPDGILVATVGRSDTTQTLVKIKKKVGGYNYVDLKKVRFLPILEGKETYKTNNSHIRINMDT